MLLYVNRKQDYLCCDVLDYGYSISSKSRHSEIFFVKVLFDAATVQGQLDFEGSICIDQHARSFNNKLFVCTYNVCAHTYIVVDSVSCSEILRAAFIGMGWLKYAATFRGWRDFEVQRDFKGIRYYGYVDLSVVDQSRFNGEKTPP